MPSVRFAGVRRWGLNILENGFTGESLCDRA